jgi:O-antigen ligase
LRYLLALLILVFGVSDVMGWSMSLAQGLSVKNAMLYLLMLGLAIRFVVRGGLRLELRSVYLWYGVLIVYAMLTWLTAGIIIQYQSYELLAGAIDLKTNLVDNLILLTLYLYGTRNSREAEFLLKWVLIVVAAANLIAIGNVGGLWSIGTTQVGNEGNLVSRVYGAFGHANETAALIVCLLPAYVALAMSSGFFSRVFWALCAVTGVALLILTGSRGGIVALLASAAIGSYLSRRLISFHRAAAFALPIGAVVIAVVAVVSIKFGDVLTQRMYQLVLDPTASGDDRTSIWMPIVSMMSAHPITLLTGFGWSVYNVMGFQYAAHNQYLMLWFELGVVGVLSWLMIMIQTLVVAKRAADVSQGRTQRYMIAFLYGVSGLLVAVFFGLLFHPWPYIWIYIGVSMRIAVAALESSRATSSRVERRVTREERAAKQQPAHRPIRVPAPQRGR